MKNAIWITTLAILAAQSVQAGIPGGWDNHNKPSWFDKTEFNQLTIDYKLEDLPMKGQMTDHLAWSDSYWPTNTGGIAFRWNDPRAAAYTDTRANDPDTIELRKSLGFNYHLYSKKEVAKMTYDQLKVLSPAEKYDIFTGHFNYPTVRHERAKTSPMAAYWFGICDGWTPASINHAEPAPINEKDANGVVQDPVLSKDGFLIPFGSSDVKAMLNHYYNRTHEKSAEAWIAEREYKVANAALIGLKCGQDITTMTDPKAIAECADMNAGAFHVVLTNQLGLQGRGIGIDIDAGNEIWNQPIFAYETKELSEQGPSRGAAPGTVREVVVQTDVYYSDDTFKGKAYWQPLVGTNDFLYDVIKYQYRLELNSLGNVIGGEWEKRDLSAEFSWLDTVDRNTAKFRALNDYEKPPLRSKIELIHSRPAELWIQRKANFSEGFGGYYGDIYKIYRPAKAGPVDFHDVKPGYVTEREDYEEYMKTP